jgi:hypothetical protein
MLGIYVLIASPGVDTYTPIAVIVFGILVVTGYREQALLQPYNLFNFFFFFYNFTSHFLFELSGLAVLGAFHSDANRDNIVRQALIAYCFMVTCAPLFSNTKGSDRTAVSMRLEQLRERLDPRRLLTLSAVSFLVTSAVFAPMLTIVLKNGFIDRVQSSAYINSNIWLIVGLMSYVGSLLSILSMRTNKGYATTALILFASYFLMDMTIGGRKILFYLILNLAAWMSASRAFRFKHLFYGAGAVILPIAMRATIDKVDLVERDLTGIAAGIFGEFLFTSGTGYIIDANYQAICRNVDITSYFYWLIYLVPRVVYESKPYSLAMNFANYMDMGMGFALTPIAEAYCVGYQSAWACMLGSTLVLFAGIALAMPRSIIIYLIGIALSMDMNRGEFSYTVVQVATLYIVYKILIRLASRRPVQKPAPIESSLLSDANGLGQPAIS